MSSGSLTKGDSNQSPQLQRLLEKLKFANGRFGYDTFQKTNIKTLISFRGCAGWYAPLFVHKGPYIINTF